MKNFLCACVITIFAFQTIAFAQSINLPADTVTKLLCKKWEIDYAVFQGQKIDMPSSTPKVYMEFYKDGTLSIIGGEPDADETGTWSYDKSKGAISMSTKGKSHKEIIFLTKDQFATFADDPVSDPNHPNRVSLKAKVYFKVKQPK